MPKKKKTPIKVLPAVKSNEPTEIGKSLSRSDVLELAVLDEKIMRIGTEAKLIRETIDKEKNALVILEMQLKEKRRDIAVHETHIKQIASELRMIAEQKKATVRNFQQTYKIPSDTWGYDPETGKIVIQEKT